MLTPITAATAAESLAAARPPLRPVEPYPGAAWKQWATECPQGHSVRVTVQQLRQDTAKGRTGWNCPACRRASRQADAIDLLTGLGLRPVTPVPPEREWSGQWPVTCVAAGHETTVRPSELVARQKRGTIKWPCGECARRAGRSVKGYTDAEARARMVAHRITPDDVPYPGAHVGWPAACMTCGHRWAPKLAFAGRVGCPRCAAVANAARQAMPADVALRIITGAGFHPMAPYPGTGGARWALRCRAGHEFSSTASAVRSGTDCPRCFHLRRAAGMRRAEVDAVAVMRAAGLEPLEPYTGNNDPWPCRCIAFGHRVSPRYSSVVDGRRCYVCSTRARGERTRVDGNSAPAFVYLVRYVDSDGTPFVKVGIGLESSRYNRVERHVMAGAEVLELVRCEWWAANAAETSILARLRPRFGYIPVRPGGGPYGYGAETLRDSAPVKLSSVFPVDEPRAIAACHM